MALDVSARYVLPSSWLVFSSRLLEYIAVSIVLHAYPLILLSTFFEQVAPWDLSCNLSTFCLSKALAAPV